MTVKRGYLRCGKTPEPKNIFAYRCLYLASAFLGQKLHKSSVENLSKQLVCPVQAQRHYFLARNTVVDNAIFLKLKKMYQLNGIFNVNISICTDSL